VVRDNLSDGVDARSARPTCVDIRAGGTTPNVETAEGNSLFSGF
jgi:hypothetical protein